MSKLQNFINFFKPKTNKVAPEPAQTESMTTSSSVDDEVTNIDPNDIDDFVEGNKLQEIERAKTAEENFWNSDKTIQASIVGQADDKTLQAIRDYEMDRSIKESNEIEKKLNKEFADLNSLITEARDSIINKEDKIREMENSIHIRENRIKEMKGQIKQGIYEVSEGNLRIKEMQNRIKEIKGEIKIIKSDKKAIKDKIKQWIYEKKAIIKIKNVNSIDEKAKIAEKYGLSGRLQEYISALRTAEELRQKNKDMSRLIHHKLNGNETILDDAIKPEKEAAKKTRLERGVEEVKKALSVVMTPTTKEEEQSTDEKKQLKTELAEVAKSDKTKDSLADKMLSLTAELKAHKDDVTTKEKRNLSPEEKYDLNQSKSKVRIVTERISSVFQELYMLDSQKAIEVLSGDKMQNVQDEVQKHVLLSFIDKKTDIAVELLNEFCKGKEGKNVEMASNAISSTFAIKPKQAIAFLNACDPTVQNDIIVKSLTLLTEKNPKIAVVFLNECGKDRAQKALESLKATMPNLGAKVEEGYNKFQAEVAQKEEAGQKVEGVKDKMENIKNKVRQTVHFDGKFSDVLHTSKINSFSLPFLKNKKSTLENQQGRQ